jgi:hypothetical protein
MAASLFKFEARQARRQVFAGRLIAELNAALGNAWCDGRFSLHGGVPDYAMFFSSPFSYRIWVLYMLPLDLVPNSTALYFKSSRNHPTVHAQKII